MQTEKLEGIETDDFEKLYKKVRIGRIMGFCECAADLIKNKAASIGLMSETNIFRAAGITQDMAKKYACPETYKILEQTVFALEQKPKRKTGRSL